jgi:hypothetical protein
MTAGHAVFNTPQLAPAIAQIRPATPYFAVPPPDAKPPLDLNKALMDRYRPKMRKFYLGEQPRLF